MGRHKERFRLFSRLLLHSAAAFRGLSTHETTARLFTALQMAIGVGFAAFGHQSGVFLVGPYHFREDHRLCEFFGGDGQKGLHDPPNLDEGRLPAADLGVDGHVHRRGHGFEDRQIFSGLRVERGRPKVRGQGFYRWPATFDALALRGFCGPTERGDLVHFAESAAGLFAVHRLCHQHRLPGFRGDDLFGGDGHFHPLGAAAGLSVRGGGAHLFGRGPEQKNKSDTK